MVSDYFRHNAYVVMYLSHAPEFENFDTTNFTYVKTFLLVCSVLIIQQVYHVMKFLFITSCS